MSLGAFLTDESEIRFARVASLKFTDSSTEMGSWADEMEDMPVCKCLLLYAAGRFC